MKKLRLISLFFSTLFVLTLLVSSCKKDDDNSTKPSGTGGSTLRTTVAGRITSTDGSVMPGVIVKLGYITTISDSRGNFLFANTEVSASRMVLSASKSGYFNSLLQNSLNNIYIVIDSIGTYGNGNFQITTLNQLIVTDYGSPGSLLTGTFEYNAYPGTITNGQFSIER